MSKKYICDGCEAAADIAYRLTRLSVIYPITPSSPMGEYYEQWSAQGKPNIFGDVPEVSMMQSEAGAIGAVHGALQVGQNATTFTASQGLLLMIPNMYKIAGELHPFVMHVAARSVATHALSIFGDHSDVMGVRETGFAMLCANSVQEAHDMAAIAHLATYKTSVPFLHFFDGFRTSHEIASIEKIDDKVLSSLIDPKWYGNQRKKALTPESDAMRGTAQNPDVFFQAREACNPYYEAVPGAVEELMEKFGEKTGRKYKLVEYVGSPKAKKVIIMMGSGADATDEVVEEMVKKEKVGLVKIRLYRPFPLKAFADALPKSVKKIAVLDRTKEPGALGEPLYLDIITALKQIGREGLTVIGGRYGLSSKEFNPACIKAVYAELDKKDPKHSFTVGIYDDLSNTSLMLEEYHVPFNGFRAIMFGLGSDGTVGAAKNSAKIISAETDQYVQNYSVYDSKKAGGFTGSHLRVSDKPIRSTYLVEQADFISCAHFPFLETQEILGQAKDGATVLLNAPYKAEEIWDKLPRTVEEQIISKKLNVYIIDASRTARDLGLGRRINTLMQTCFFGLTPVLETERAKEILKGIIEKAYGKKGKKIVDLNCKAVDAALDKMYKLDVQAAPSENAPFKDDSIWMKADEFTKTVTKKMIEGKGDDIPVSAFAGKYADGTFPTGTTKLEKRRIADQVPVWDPETCIQCGKCAFVCPHAAVRSKAFDDKDAPKGGDFKSAPYKGKELGENMNYTIQVSPADCTGCTLCVEACPMKGKTDPIKMAPIDEVYDAEAKRFEQFEKIPELDKSKLNMNMLKHTQLSTPLFEYSGACAGCGETPYLKLLTQLFGDHMVIANATGCSSIYGGNLPTTPYTKNEQGLGPAWSNSLFENNAEYGYGMKIAEIASEKTARRLLIDLEADGKLDSKLVNGLLNNSLKQSDDKEIAAQRARVAELKQILKGNSSTKAKELLDVADTLIKRSTWIVGGDGWAYDIGYGGLDHILHSGENINILIMDTEAYSNTGGQQSKSTPMGASAKFASSGRELPKKDLGAIAMSSKAVYVAKIALGANEAQAIKAFREAEAFDGPSIILAYSPCVAHGIDLSKQLQHQKLAVSSGHWGLYRFNPDLLAENKNPLSIDSNLTEVEKFDKYTDSENRYQIVKRSDPKLYKKLMKKAKSDILRQHFMYKAFSETEPEDSGDKE